ncbi:hypothetical protein HDU82_000010 [Entophlyctis luteolus]|nr:hypothetical protein HDU82_000010 [Entophlyctis luteolus]
MSMSASTPHEPFDVEAWLTAHAVADSNPARANANALSYGSSGSASGSGASTADSLAKPPLSPRASLGVPVSRRVRDYEQRVSQQQQLSQTPTPSHGATIRNSSSSNRLSSTTTASGVAATSSAVTAGAAPYATPSTHTYIAPAPTRPPPHHKRRSFSSSILMMLMPTSTFAGSTSTNAYPTPPHRAQSSTISEEDSRQSHHSRATRGGGAPPSSPVPSSLGSRESSTNRPAFFHCVLDDGIDDSCGLCPSAAAQHADAEANLSLPSPILVESSDPAFITSAVVTSPGPWRADEFECTTSEAIRQEIGSNTDFDDEETEDGTVPQIAPLFAFVI